jgi:hypothetical protein
VPRSKEQPVSTATRELCVDLDVRSRLRLAPSTLVSGHVHRWNEEGSDGVRRRFSPLPHFLATSDSGVVGLPLWSGRNPGRAPAFPRSEFARLPTRATNPAFFRALIRATYRLEAARYRLLASSTISCLRGSKRDGAIASAKPSSRLSSRPIASRRNPWFVSQLMRAHRKPLSKLRSDFHGDEQRHEQRHEKRKALIDECNTARISFALRIACDSNRKKTEWRSPVAVANVKTYVPCDDGSLLCVDRRVHVRLQGGRFKLYIIKELREISIRRRAVGFRLGPTLAEAQPFRTAVIVLVSVAWLVPSLLSQVLVHPYFPTLNRFCIRSPIVR